MIIDEDAYLEHYGVKGMQWGVRAAKSTGRGAKRAGKAVGRGAMATGRAVRAHPDVALKVAAGAVAVASAVATVGHLRTSELPPARFNAIDVTFRDEMTRVVSSITD